MADEPRGTYAERLEQFETLVKRHDLTWDYADDARARQRGRAELEAIKQVARTLRTDDVTRVWNAQVQQKLVEQAWHEYTWTDPRQWGGRDEQALTRDFGQRVAARLMPIHEQLAQKAAQLRADHGLETSQRSQERGHDFGR